MLKMDEINKIRKAFLGGENRYALAKRFNRSWDTINRIIDIPRENLSNRGKRSKKQSKFMTPQVLDAIEAYLQDEIAQNVKRKQRYTAKKIFNELKQKTIYHGSLRNMQKIVKALREKHNLSKKQTYIPLEFPLGSSIQVDHGEVDVIVAEERRTAYLFVASIPGQVLRYCQVFPMKSQEAWGEFHEKFFSFFGGVFPEITYDNDSVLIKRVSGAKKEQTDFSLHLEEHYGFKSCFCNVASGNEKGAVENAVGYCRRNFLAGCPEFKDWNQLNLHLISNCTKEIEQGIHYKTQEKTSSIFEKLKTMLLPLLQPKKWRRWVNSRVDRCQLITVDRHFYSVPEKFVGVRVDVALTAFGVEVFKEQEPIAIHSRQFGKDDSLCLDHYLDQLARKPLAFNNSKAVHQHQFPFQLQRVWEYFQQRKSKKEANAQFIEILLLGRQHPKLLEAIELSFQYGAVNPSSITNLANQLEIPKQMFDTESVKKLLPENKGINFIFDLSRYGELCGVRS